MSPVRSAHALVLKVVRFGDSSLIINVYTREFGVLGLMARGVCGGKRKFSAALFQPLNLVEIVFSEHRKSALYYLKELSVDMPYRTIPFDFHKSSILMFLNEILYKTLKEEPPNSLLFDYIRQSLLLFDTLDERFSDFHLYFLAGLTLHLGIVPNFTSDGDWFDLLEGCNIDTQPVHAYFLESDIQRLFERLFDHFPEHYQPLSISNRQRRMLLDSLLTYYELHLPGFHDIQSKAILQEMYRG